MQMLRLTRSTTTLSTDAPDLSHILHARNPRDDGTKHHRPDDHFDQLDKGISQRFHLTANSGAIVPSTMPMTIAKSTCMYKVLASFFMTFLKKKSIVAVIEFGARRNLWDYPRSTRCKYLKTLKKLALTSRKPK